MSIELPRNHIEDWVFDRILKGFLGHANAFFLLVKSKAGALLQMNFGSYAIFLSAPMRLRVIPSTGILYRLTRRSPLILLLRKNSLVHGSVDLQLTDKRFQ